MATYVTSQRVQARRRWLCRTVQTDRRRAWLSHVLHRDTWNRNRKRNDFDHRVHCTAAPKQWWWWWCCPRFSSDVTAKDFRSASSVLFLFDFMLRGVGSRSRRTPRCLNQMFVCLANCTRRVSGCLDRLLWVDWMFNNAINLRLIRCAVFVCVGGSHKHTNHGTATTATRLGI